MEYIKKGAVLSKSYWRHEMSQSNRFNFGEADAESMKKNRLSEAKAKKYFRHLVMALDYSKSPNENSSNSKSA